MNQYTLEPYTTPSSRHRCPQCNDRRKTFKRYINIDTGEHLADHVGLCDRENNCGYHYHPGQYFEAERGWRRVERGWGEAQGVPGSRKFKARKKTPTAMRHALTQPPTADRQPHAYINPEIVNATFKHYERNNFAQYLINKFGLDIADQLVGRYRIGTSRYWPGATVFWQLDTQGGVRTGKVMLYDKETGKRVKKPFPHVTWAHALLVGSGQYAVGTSQLEESSFQLAKTNANCQPQTANFKLKQCLFGEHLLTEHPAKPVAIVESEKTAIITSAYDDSFVWLAAGSINNLNAEICKPLTGRQVTLYPDLSAYDKWKAKAQLLQAAIPGSTITVSDMLERMANDDDREKGLDLGDFLDEQIKN